jgi:hypothetical protein
MGGWGFGVGGGVGVGFGRAGGWDRLTRPSEVFRGMRFGVWRGNQGVRDCGGLRVWEPRGTGDAVFIGVWTDFVEIAGGAGQAVLMNK